MGEVIVIGRLCCLGFTVSRDQVHSTIRSTANIAQVQSLKTGSIVFPLVTFSCNENTLYVSKYTPKHTQQNSGWQPLPLSPMQLLQWRFLIPMHLEHSHFKSHEIWFPFTRTGDGNELLVITWSPTGPIFHSGFLNQDFLILNSVLSRPEFERSIFYPPGVERFCILLNRVWEKYILSTQSWEFLYSLDLGRREVYSINPGLRDSVLSQRFQYLPRGGWVWDLTGGNVDLCLECRRTQLLVNYHILP